MSDQEAPNAKPKQRFQPGRIVCAVGLVTILAMLLYERASVGGHDALMIISQPVLAALLGLFVLCVSRWLEGPVRLKHKRRNQLPHSRSASAIFLWLTCFAAFQVAFTISAWSVALLHALEPAAAVSDQGGEALETAAEDSNNVPRPAAPANKDAGKAAGSDPS
jgi:phosphate/sulfate permease